MMPAPVQIMPAAMARLDDWAAMRAALWPDQDAASHRDQLTGLLHDADMQAFIADRDGRPIGFAEAALRHDHVNGCDTSPVVFLEGIHVVPEARGQGVGRALCAAVAACGAARGMLELASDAGLDNDASLAFHAALGLQETERVVCFRRRLTRQDMREDRPA